MYLVHILHTDELCPEKVLPARDGKSLNALVAFYRARYAMMIDYDGFDVFLILGKFYH